MNLNRNSVCAAALILVEKFRSGLLCFVFVVHGTCFAADAPLTPIVEVEEDIYVHAQTGNGAGPQWDFGSTNMIRFGNEVFVSGLDAIHEVKPLNNVQCNLFRRNASGWSLVLRDPTGRTREPCPLVVLQGSAMVLMSTNPTLLSNTESGGGPSKPTILEILTSSPSATPKIQFPAWQGEGSPKFTEHSYRSFASDNQLGESIIFQNIENSHAEWSFRSAHGDWIAAGKLVWPWDTTYEKPQPIRICYPNVVVANRSVYFVGVSDVMEPNQQWLTYKRKITGQSNPYAFRRLFYTWTTDIQKGFFNDWVEIASRDETAGRIAPGDLWVSSDGSAHIVWQETALDDQLRDFFPGKRQRREINYAVVKQGKIILHKTLVSSDEGTSELVPSSPRFHLTPDGRIFVIIYVNGVLQGGKSVSENRIAELHLDGTTSTFIRIPLSRPFTNYFTATTRAGSLPSYTLDLLGTSPDSPNTIRYARVKLRRGVTK